MAVDDKKWGILYCPKHRSGKQRERIQRALNEHGVDYDFVQSETAGSVERLINMLIHNGYKTIIIAGGDSALNDAVNCLMKVEKQMRDTIALGLIPNGLMNDFARYWNFREGNLDQTISWLKKYRVRPIDLGCVRYTNKKGEQCHRYFLNCINIGMVADVMNLRQQTRAILGSRFLSIILSAILLIFHRMDYKMSIKINAETIQRRVMTLCIGSGPGYGLTPNAVPYNGLLDVSLVYQAKIVQIFHGLWMMLTGRLLNHRMVHPYRTQDIVIEDGGKALVSVDGRPMGTPVGSYRINVEQEVIRFLIPD